MKTVRHSAKFKIEQPVEILFPLFSAEGEKLWVPGWDYVNIMGSTELHEDYIFLTENNEEQKSETIWLTKRHQPESYFVQFYKIDPEDKVGIVTVQCIQINDNTTEVEVTYEYTGLSEQGDAFIDEFTAAHYRNYIGEWKTLLDQYFQSIE